jgi:hypothetical protein
MVVAGASPPDGFGPQAAPQSPMTHFTVSALADHCPESVTGSSARAVVAPSTATSMTVTAPQNEASA